MYGLNIFLLLAYFSQHSFQHKRLYHLRNLLKFTLPDSNPCPLFPNALSPRNFRLFFQKYFDIPQLLHHLIDVGNGLFIHLLLKIRQNMIPDTISHIRITLIGLVHTKVNSFFFQIFLNFTTLYRKKRPNHIPIDRTYATESFQTRSSCHIHEKCLRIIILVVRKCNLCSTVFPQCLCKGLSAHFTPCLLQRLFPFFCN